MRNFLNKKPIFILAPMVGNSGYSWRKLARKYGSDLCYTEMVHSETFINSKSDIFNNRWYKTDETDRPLVIQICGNDPKIMSHVASKVESVCDMIDINFGCPQKVAKRGHYGAYLQEDWDLTSKIINSVSSSINLPLSCKIRIFEDFEITRKYSEMIQNSGCNFLVVHGRTRNQRGKNSGLASWDHIKFIKESLRIPVISNGNIIYYKNLQEALDYTKADGIMVGETHLYNPLIFKNIKKSVFEILNEYFEICFKSRDENLSEIKSHTFKLLHKILKKNKEFYKKIGESQSLNELKNNIDSIKEFSNSNIYPEPYIRDN